MEYVYRKSYQKQATYIIRFDDLCPEMNSFIWNQIEVVLYRHKIKPIIAVVPNNQDVELKKQTSDPLFWNKIKKYQDDGFMVALHGYNHVYQNKASGTMGISSNSEFSGISYEKQQEKIFNGIEIFKKHQIKPDAFIAPSHSFDNTTLKVLKGKVQVICDGHLSYPFWDKNFLWIPCQIWDRLMPKKHGLYTVCIHPNNWTYEDVTIFEEDIKKFRERIISPFDITDAETLSVWGKLKTISISIIFKFKYQVKRVFKLCR